MSPEELAVWTAFYIAALPEALKAWPLALRDGNPQAMATACTMAESAANFSLERWRMRVRRQ